MLFEPIMAQLEGPTMRGITPADPIQIYLGKEDGNRDFWTWASRDVFIQYVVPLLDNWDQRPSGSPFKHEWVVGSTGKRSLTFRHGSGTLLGPFPFKMGVPTKMGRIHARRMGYDEPLQEGDLEMYDVSSLNWQYDANPEFFRFLKKTAKIIRSEIHHPELKVQTFSMCQALPIVLISLRCKGLGIRGTILVAAPFTTCKDFAPYVRVFEGRDYHVTPPELHQEGNGFYAVHTRDPYVLAQLLVYHIERLLTLPPRSEEECDV